MPRGPGRYDALCTEVREKAHARGALLIILGGVHGDGFAVQLAPDLMSRELIPTLLRRVAAEIEASVKPSKGVH